MTLTWSSFHLKIWPHTERRQSLIKNLHKSSNTSKKRLQFPVLFLLLHWKWWQFIMWYTQYSYENAKQDDVNYLSSKHMANYTDIITPFFWEMFLRSHLNESSIKKISANSTMHVFVFRHKLIATYHLFYLHFSRQKSYFGSGSIGGVFFGVFSWGLFTLRKSR